MTDPVSLLKTAASFLPKAGDLTRSVDGVEWTVSTRRDTIQEIDKTHVLSVQVLMTRDAGKLGQLRIPTSFVMLSKELDTCGSDDAIQDYVEDSWRVFLLILEPDMEKNL